jgi:hypothetical protein
MADAPGLASIEHVVVLMLENRSFDHMLGYLYSDAGNVSPAGQPFDGLTGSESNPGSSGQPVPVSRIEPGTANAYFMPGADPGEGYMATNQQLYGTDKGPTAAGETAPCNGYITDYAYTLGWEAKEKWPIVAGTTEQDIMGCFTPDALPPLVFLEPSWTATGNSQHPNYDVALGEQLIHDVYEALRTGPGWPLTLFVLTYDEHGGCYDHVSPPWGATPPDNTAGEFGFDFTRFGVRVPTLLISPLIAPGTVYRVPSGSTPLDHTSILKTVEQRWSLPALTARDGAAPGLGDVLTLATARTDDVLSGVTVPVSGGTSPAAGQLSHLEAIREELISRALPAGAHPVPPANAVIEP